MKIRIRDLQQFNTLLIRKGHSKNRFSKAAGVSSPMFVPISNGDRRPGPQTAKRIADALKVEWDNIFEAVWLA